MDIDYPFHLDGRGRTAQTDTDDHIRDLIEQVLFTSPGERVNRPDFGAGLLQLVFQPASEPLVAAVRMAVQGALHKCLSDRIRVEDVATQVEDSTLRVAVRYQVLKQQQPVVAVFTRTL
jgi:phage baseplate assembly protein W